MILIDLLRMPGLTIFMFVLSALIMLLGLIAYGLERHREFKKNKLKKLRALKDVKV